MSKTNKTSHHVEDINGVQHPVINNLLVKPVRVRVALSEVTGSKYEEGLLDLLAERAGFPAMGSVEYKLDGHDGDDLLFLVNGDVSLHIEEEDAEPVVYRPPLTRRQYCTVLAALRYWQRRGLQSVSGEPEMMLAADACEPLSSAEIDHLYDGVMWSDKTHLLTEDGRST